MTKLSSSQLDFLSHHRIPLSEVFDATGIPKKKYQALMRQAKKHIAIGVSPCAKADHTMRTRSGHCIQCNPANIAFQLRSDADGTIYLAGSQSEELLKIGFSKNINNREYQINTNFYGGANDWEMIFWIEVDQAGTIEIDIHKVMHKFSVPGTYFSNNVEIDCYELYKCNASVARNAIKSQVLASSCSIKLIFQAPHFKHYNFIRR